MIFFERSKEANLAISSWYLAEKEGFEPSKPFCGLHDFQTHPIIASTRRYNDYYFALLFYAPKNLFYFF